MSAVVSQITSLTIVYLTIYSGADKNKTKETWKLRVTGFCEGDLPVNSTQKRPVTRKMFPFDDVIMLDIVWCIDTCDHRK